MSEPIQSIAQNNYILHNIDAKKLYVQEPLFTANSGDAVYVGWRPDETVLWSGELSYGNSATLSESVKNFEKIRFKWTDWGSTQTIHFDEFASQSELASFYSMVGSWYGGSSPSANITLFKLNCHDNGSNVMSFDNAIFLATTATAVNLATQTRITEIVGVNRKENA